MVEWDKMNKKNPRPGKPGVEGWQKGNVDERTPYPLTIADEGCYIA